MESSGTENKLTCTRIEHLSHQTTTTHLTITSNTYIYCNSSEQPPPSHTTVLWPFFRDHPGKLVPEENFWTSWCKKRLTEADTPTIRLGATPSGLTSAHLHHPPFFYRPDARVLLNSLTCTISVP